MKRLSLAMSLAVSMLACGSNSPTTATALTTPTPQPTFTISGVIAAVTPTRPAPLEGAQVFVSGHRTMTDGQGRYSIAGLDANTFGFSVTASKAGYASATTNLTKSVDATVDMQLVRTAIYTLSGVVSEVTSTGRVTIEGVRVDVSSMPCDERGTGCVGFGEGIGLFQTATTDKNGFYSIPGLYPGKYNVIWASKDGFDDPFPAQYPENSEGGRAITIDGDSRFDLQLVRR
jgi:carboxypeptidase family protein